MQPDKLFFKLSGCKNFVVISFSKTLNYVKYRNYQNFCDTKNKSMKKGLQTLQPAALLTVRVNRKHFLKLRLLAPS